MIEPAKPPTRRRAWPALLLLLPALLVLPGCPDGGEAGEEGAEAAAADTLTRREKDSIVSEMGLPGSGAVGKAMRAVDSINARSARHDSIAGGNR